MKLNKRIVLPGVLALALAPLACDFDVTNPGPVQSDFLLEPAAQPALVSGMGRGVAEALNWVAYTSAAVAREIHPSGSTGSFGITGLQQKGTLREDEVNTQWFNGQRARFLSESGIAIIEDEGESEPGLLAQAYLWSGYANRLMGENMCQAVIDGGSPQPSTEFLDRAEAAFRQAATLGSGDVQTAAQAGLASVLAQQGRWSEVPSVASQVPTSFSYVVEYSNDFGDDTRNRLQFASAEQPYRAHTQWNTWVEGYGLSDDNPSGDPRVPYMLTNKTGDAAVECCGQVDWWPQDKYPDPGADVELSSGAEMRLLEAEAMLMDGDWQGAMAIVNDLRTAAGMPTETATSEAEAWGYYKREHAIEMWLEGRRLGALRRWNDAGLTEDDLHPLEQVSGDVATGSHLETRDYCFPISESERQTNPNVS
ncbi:MAG: RagB/SusD family nutrient uptake outer membrane protein [Gemmatimonadota bacterium]|nr:RagB/SusD family nutrient uptake outer membrane protein [Gemmatimonadota bacterium]